MYGVKVRKQYAKLYKEVLEKLASAFGIRLTPPEPQPTGRK